MSKKIFDELSRRIKSEFEEILKNAEDLELDFEDNVPEFTEDITREEAEAIIDSITNLIEKYEEFLIGLSSIAGETVGFSKEGQKAFQELKSAKKKLEKLKEMIRDFSGLLKKMFATLNNDSLNDTKKIYLEKINEAIQELRDFFSEKIYENIYTLMSELEKIETYYESSEEE
ncbi:MAG: hypothetical protein ACTSVA_01245 [Candidatus Njordarchaeales archaeon]|mgnify:CR=1 FL=1